MWLEIFVVLHFILLPNNISCQPVTDSNIVRDTRQTTFEECCPCSRDDGNDFGEQDMSPSSPMGSFAQDADDCPCRLSKADSQGSSSIFRPFILRGSRPTEREQSKQPMKPLLQPEVGLASSVLETIQKATDEEYQEALARDAARNLVEIESGFLDSEPGNSRNSVTIVLNPREDLYDGDDAMPEASHVHETRCIHGPLGRASLPSNKMAALSKQNLLLKRKPVGYPYKSLSDMDNSASNIKENYDINYNNGLNTKLRMNPLSLNALPIRNDKEIVNDPISKFNSRYKLRKITPEYCNELENNEFNNSPKFRLAAIRNRLRELVDMSNIKPLNKAPTTFRQNIFSHKGSPAIFEANSPLDALFDKKSPALKNILKLKDVELIPPRKIISKDLTEEKDKLSDLKFAGSQNNVILSNINKDKSEKHEECDVNNLNKSKEYMSKDQTAIEREVVTSVPIDTDSSSDEIQTITEKLENSKDSSNELPQLLNECLRLVTNSQDVVVNGGEETDSVNDSSEYDSKEVNDISKMEDLVAETSDNVNEESQEDNVDASNVQRTTKESIHVPDSLLKQENSGLTTFKNDVLRKLKNIKETIKSKLEDTETIIKPIVSKQVNEKTATNQDLSDSDLNSESNKNVAVTLTPANERDISIQDLQNLSDSLLEQENSLKAKTISYPYENNKNQDETYINTTKDDTSVSSEFDSIDTDMDENQVSSEDEREESNSLDGQENKQSGNPKYTCDVVSKENNDINTDNTRPEDSAINEMSYQASNSKYNTIIPPLKDEGSPTLQDTFSLFKTPLQIPSLEQIRQDITDIIDAGQQDTEEFQQTDFDPLNQSSNRNSVQSNLPKFNYIGNSLTDRYIRPLTNTRSNIGGYKSIFETVTKPWDVINEQLSNPTSLRSYPLSLDRAKSAGNQIFRSPSETVGVPSLDDIKRFLDTQNHLKRPNIQLPRTDIIKRPTFPNARKTNQGNQLLSKPILETEDILHSMTRKHEDMKEKLQALHMDFNDRLASVYKRLNDQKKIQSVNNPTFKDKSNSLALPTSISKTERNRPNLISDNFLFEPQMLREQTPMNKKIKPQINTTPLQIPTRNNNLNKMKENNTLKERGVNKFPNLSDKRKYMKQQKSLTPISKVKISFTTTTSRPNINSGTKLQKSPDTIKVPSRLLEKERKADSNLKDISKALRSRLQSLGDSSHAPSELIETKKLNEALANSDNKPVIGTNKPRINLGQTTDTNNLVPTKKESPLITNLREALRARLENVTKTHTTTAKTKHPVEATNLKTADAIVSPSNIKTSVYDNPLVENTPYKCTMMCSKDL